EPLAGGPAAVAGDRAGLCDDPPPEDPLPPSEIHVLEIREVLVVETGGQELLAPNRHQAAAGEETLLPGNGAGERSDGPLPVLVEGVGVEGKEAVGEVVLLARRVHEPARGGDDVGRRRGERAGQQRERRRIYGRVVVDEREDRGARRLGAEAAS